MPNRDRTGPEGKGARTGRGAGNCPVDDSEPTRRRRPRRLYGNRNRGR